MGHRVGIRGRVRFVKCTDRLNSSGFGEIYLKMLVKRDHVRKGGLSFFFLF